MPGKLLSQLSILGIFILLSGCSYLGMDNPFTSDPLTGGMDVQTSKLLNVPIPAGLQVYPSHGYIATGGNGGPEGLETYRGNVDGYTAALALFNTLKANGWQLRLSLRKGHRALYLYQKNGEYAVLTFHRQGLLTILEIWQGSSLPDGAMPTLSKEGISDEQPDISLPGEEYGPIDENSGQNGVVEQWGGGSTLEEREL